MECLGGLYLGWDGMIMWIFVCGWRIRGWFFFLVIEVSFYNLRYILLGVVEIVCIIGMGIEGVVGVCVLGWEVIDIIIGRYCNINLKMVEVRLLWKNGDFKF